MMGSHQNVIKKPLGVQNKWAANVGYWLECIGSDYIIPSVKEIYVSVYWCYIKNIIK